MRGLLNACALAIITATAMPASAQENRFNKPFEAVAGEQEDPVDITEVKDEFLNQGTEIATSINSKGANEFIDEVAVGEKTAAIMGFAVFGSDGRKLGKVENVVMQNGLAIKLIVKLDSLVPNDQLLRAVPFGDVRSVVERRAVRLLIKKSELRKQSPFLFQDEMETIAPVTKARQRARNQTGP